VRILVLIAFGLIAGCSPTRIEIDYFGSGDFIVANKSQFSIRVELTQVPLSESHVDTSEIILPDSSRTIFSKVIIGVNVYPGNSLSSMRIFKVENSSLTVIYEQNPINESKWKFVKRLPGDYGHTDNTFVFSDSLITN
jgi:hypothetical protein